MTVTLNDKAVRRAIERAIAPTATGQWTHVVPTGWGDAWSLTIDGCRYFVKLASGRHADMLACEADGLRAIAGTRTLRVPDVALSGAEGTTAYLVLEWLDLRGSAGGAALGSALAALHRAAVPRGPRGERFGWHRDNWIGATPQSNDWSDDWCTFFRDRRLLPQLTVAFRRGFRSAIERHAERLVAALPELLRNHAPTPSLVHGDLWSGNAGALADGEPVVFDPAVYVGDREVDVAMTELFGGFERDFAGAYESAWPVAPGYPLRRDLYNLYHLLNHVNLFGAGYVSRTEQTLARLIRALDAL